tara:strand:- start:639 stop:1355 length:717 start_codon:yes stop_codon:yes gene_type:complete
MTTKAKIAVLIPAAGSGTRSKLSYPKSLHKVKNTPIIVRIINKIKKYDLCPTIIVNKKNHIRFKETINMSRSSKVEFLFQNKPTGMGDAVLKFKQSKFYKETENILLIWGDIPFIKRQNIDKLIKTHIAQSNFMTILSLYSKKPYTLIKKDKNDFVKEIIETNRNNFNFKYGERDIGIFIFKKTLLNYLNKKQSIKEHNFLYIINTLYKKKYHIKSLPIASNKEAISLNYISDLEDKL